MNIVTATDLAEQQQRLDDEAETLKAEIALMRQRADSLEVEAALTGTAAPPEAEELRQRADAGDRRLAAIAEAKRLTAEAQQARQKITDSELSAAHSLRVLAAVQSRKAAFEAVDEVLDLLDARLVEVANAHQHHADMVRHAQHMSQQGVMTIEELRPLLPVRPANRSRQDRKTGRYEPDSMPTAEENLAILRDLYEKQVLLAANGDTPRPPWLVQYHFYRLERAAMAAAGQATLES